MSQTEFSCERCGRPQETIEITTWADVARGDRHVYLPTGCDCPRPRCPFSHTPLDDQGRCQDVDCFMWFTIVPEPEMR